MKREFNHKRRRSKRASPAQSVGQVLWRWIFITALLGLVFCSGLFIYQFKKKPQNFPTIALTLSRASSWIAEHKSHLHQGLKKVKQLAVNKNDDDQQIHFEFYTALPNMQVTSSSSTSVTASAPKVVSLAQAKTVAKVAAQDEDADKEVDTDAEPESAAIADSKNNNQPDAVVASAQSNIVNANALEKDLSAQMQENGYVLQMGVFRSAESAEHYKASLSVSGYPISIITIATANKKIFRVQLGPFNNKNQARLAQIELEKQGITGTLRKLDIS